MPVRPPRLTVRRSMILVAAVAILCGLGTLVARRFEYSRLALEEEATAITCVETITIDPWGKRTPPKAEKAERALAKGRLHRERADLWRDAADHPWRARPRPKPIPD